MSKARTSKKRNDFFDYFQRSSFAILLLSETGQPTIDEIALWETELLHRGCQGLFSEFAYTGIIWKNNAHLGEPLARNRFSRTLTEPHQLRCTDVVFSLDNVPTHFMAVYAPTDPVRRAPFFTSLIEALPALRYRQHLWGGDWNCVHSPELDAAHLPVSQDHTSALLETLFNTLQAGDTFRLSGLS
ncbi:hypothetical protein V1517DRAFT_315946 [Lipomyces orientalis]|uniref:Uncharacterized protein n=1 Tax=Lipomyces orientalis TaxID=1233043 RepID=A0ACC3TVR0_9ASCO